MAKQTQLDKLIKTRDFVIVEEVKTKNKNSSPIVIEDKKDIRVNITNSYGEIEKSYTIREVDSKITFAEERSAILLEEIATLKALKVKLEETVSKTK